MISVIVPIFNAHKYIARCIDSLNNQSYPWEELVLVDDGSTDGSAELCDRYAKEDKRILVIHQQNQGASVARRVGIESAKGDYLTFMDCDDYIEPDYLEQLMNAIQKYNVEIAACDYLKRKENDIVEVLQSREARLMEESKLYERFFKYDFWGYCGKIYHRDVFESIYFPKATINEDYAVMAQLFSKCNRMAYVPIPLYHYIKHEGSLSNTIISEKAFDEYYNKKWVLDYFTENNSRYRKQAEAQLVETCIKLCSRVQGSGRKTLKDKKAYKEMFNFLKNNILNIVKNPFLLFGLKFMSFRIILRLP